MTKRPTAAAFAALVFCILSVSLAAAALVPIQTAPTQTAPTQTAPAQTPPTQTAPAQTPPTQQNGQVPSAGKPATGEAAQQVEGWNRILDGIQQALGREGVTDDQLAGYSNQAGGIFADANKLIADLTPRLQAIRQQINQLGPAPGEGEPPEADAVASKRAELQKALTQVDGVLKEARLSMVRAEQIESAILAKRRDRFVRSLTLRSRTLFSPSLWTDTAAGLPGYMKSLGLLVRESASASSQRVIASPLALASLLLQIAIGIVVFWYLRRLVRADRAGAASAAGHLRDFARYGVLPALLLVYFGRVATASELVTDRFGQLLAISFGTFSVFFAATALLRVFTRPSRQELRIFDLGDGAARSVFAIATSAIFAVTILRILNATVAMLLAPFEISVMMSAALALVCIVASVRILTVVARDRASREAAETARLIRWAHVRPLIWIAVAVSAAGLVFGYIALAEFVSYQLIVALIAIALLWLVQRWIDEAKQAALERERAGLGRIAATTGISTASSRQVAIVGFGMLRLVAFVVAAMALLLPWGVQTRDWLVLVKRAYFGFEVGDLTISVSAIVTALALFLIGILLTRAIQQWLAGQFLPTTRLDAGLRNSITTILGYIGIVLVAVIAISAAGLDLTNLAIVAGALSVGIGFGLQSIVNNFVSGLILLAERPIKAGDWIITSGGEGTVKRISVRSTEIETFDRAMVIVPNSTLITETLTNWTHRSKLGRIIVRVGVGYDSDPEQVRQILLDCATANETIVTKPEPQVYFMDFGNDALIFDLRAYVADITDGFGVKSDLRFAILAALRAAGIEIPYPQRDLHIKSGLETLSKPQAATSQPVAKVARKAAPEPAPKPAPKPAARRRTPASKGGD